MIPSSAYRSAITARSRHLLRQDDWWLPPTTPVTQHRPETFPTDDIVWSKPDKRGSLPVRSNLHGVASTLAVPSGSCVRGLYRYPVKGMSPEALERMALRAGETAPF